MSPESNALNPILWVSVTSYLNVLVSYLFPVGLVLITFTYTDKVESWDMALEWFVTLNK